MKGDFFIYFLRPFCFSCVIIESSNTKVKKLMKTHQKFLVIIIIFVTFVQLQSQWIDKGSYKELQACNASINQLIVNHNDDYFCVVDQNKIFRRFDYDGNLIFEKNLIIDSCLPDLKCYYMRCSSDGKSYIYYKIFETYKDYAIQPTYNFSVYNIDNDSLIIRKDLLSFYNEPELGWNVKNIFFDYNKKYSKGLLLGNFYWGGHHAEIYSDKECGTISIFNWESGINSQLFGNGFSSINFNSDYNYIVLSSNYKYYESGDMSGNVYQDNYSKDFVFFNLISNKSFVISHSGYDLFNPAENITGFLPDKFCIANKDSEFAALKDSILYCYKFSKDTVFLYDTFAFPNKPNFVIYSPDDKYYIVSSPDFKINIYHKASKLLVKTYLMQDSVNPNSLILSGNGKGFIAGNVKGSVKYFQPEYFSDSLRALFISDIHISQVSRQIKFYNLSTGNYDSYYWDFGDGYSSIEENPEHKYLQPGTYLIRLVVWNNNEPGYSDVIDSMIVLHALKADFDANIKNGDPPLSVQFDDLSKGNVQNIFWNFGDGDTSTVENPIHNYQKSGIYPVQLIVSDGFFNDTLIKHDYIIVNQQPIYDSEFSKEKVFLPYNYNGIKGFETINGDYIIEADSANKNLIIRLNSNFDTLWSRQFFISELHSPIQQSAKGTLFVEGRTDNEPSNFSINRLDEKGNITYTKNIPLANWQRIFEYLALDDGYIVVTTHYQLGSAANLATDVNRYNLKDSILWSYKKFIIWDMSSYCYSLKLLDEPPDSFLILANLYYNHNGIGYARIFTHFGYDGENNFLDEPKVGTTNGFNYLTSLDEINRNLFVFIEDNKTIHMFDNWTKVFKDVAINSVAVLDSERFAVCGSKSGNCWYAIMDTSGNVIEEHTITERFGWLSHVSLNKDGSLLLIGSLYKNSFVSKPQKKNKNETILTNQNDQNSLYIFKTIPFHFTEVKETNPNLDCKVNPNPSNGYVNFLINLPTESHIRLVISDMLGNQVATLANGIFSGECKFTFNSSQQGSGVFFYRLQIGTEIQSEKFMIIK
jgi:PKD repeat protein